MANKMNGERYYDPTAYAAQSSIEKRQKEEAAAVRKEEKEMSDLIGAIRTLSRVAGFEIVGRITLISTKSGREYS